MFIFIPTNIQIHTHTHTHTQKLIHICLTQLCITQMDWYGNEYWVFHSYICSAFPLAVSFLSRCILPRCLFIISAKKLCWPNFPNSIFFQFESINCKFASVFRSSNYTFSLLQNYLYVKILHLFVSFVVMFFIVRYIHVCLNCICQYWTYFFVTPFVTITMQNCDLYTIQIQIQLKTINRWLLSNCLIVVMQWMRIQQL